MYRMAIIFILAVLLPAAAAATPVPPARRGALPAGAKGPANPHPLRLTIQPEESALVGPRTRQELLVTGIDAQGHRRDLTAAARFVSLTPEVARVTPAGEVLPVGDGTATIKAVVGDRVALAAVRVRDARRARPISFANEVIPTLTRAGCNQGACHGAAAGKGGFKLSLLGYDPPADYVAIVKQAKARRLCRPHPQRSLVLLKPTLSIAHGGGRRFEVGSAPYRLLRQWIEDGAPGPQPSDPHIIGLDVLPAERVMTPRERQRLVVRARFSDGAAIDVTAQTRLSSLNEGVAAVTPDGAMTANGPGVTAVMARYMGLAAVTRVTVPFSPVAPAADRYPPPASFIDALVIRKWQALGLTPSGPCSDSDFIRRASLDVIGTLPTPE